jgi:hypothetical protein
VATHYDVLGISQKATPHEVRRAYLDRARLFHPDRTHGATPGDAEAAARRMQDVNEAWRVLRDPSSRAAYDRALSGARLPPSRPPRPPRPTAAPYEDDADDDDLDRPYPQRPAEPGDIGVTVVRGLPWVAVAVVLAAIFVFTAFAGRGDGTSSPRDLIGKCVGSDVARTLESVPCGGPNDGLVVLVVDRASLCPNGSESRSIAGNRWLCLEPVG